MGLGLVYMGLCDDGVTMEKGRGVLRTEFRGWHL